jgi:hypothetical protein
MELPPRREPCHVMHALVAGSDCLRGRVRSSGGDLDGRRRADGVSTGVNQDCQRDGCDRDRRGERGEPPPGERRKGGKGRQARQ